jgi:hypothetical protein
MYGVPMLVSEVVATYRRNAANCMALAQEHLDTGRKLALINMAQSWLTLAEHAERVGDDLTFTQPIRR